jgi:ornithine carbamoyltransferase
VTRHFLRDDDLSPGEQAEVLALAKRLKASRYETRALDGPRPVAIIFDKPTLRTQASFTAGVAELGGYPMLVDGSLARIGTRESIADTARVLGRMVSAVVWRTYGQGRIDEMAAHAGVPVVNALTDQFHPCQLLADLQTIEEQKGRLAGLTVTFLGDTASNMSHSFLLACTTAGMHVRVSGPEEFAPDSAVLEAAGQVAATTGGSASWVVDPVEAVAGADVAVTDTWVSMGKEDQAQQRERPFLPYALDEALLAHAHDDAIVMHCLPAYRGKEIAAAVIDGPRSVVWDEAENRLHAQKALLAWLMEHQDAEGPDGPEDPTGSDRTEARA